MFRPSNFFYKFATLLSNYLSTNLSTTSEIVVGDIRSVSSEPYIIIFRDSNFFSGNIPFTDDVLEYDDGDNFLINIEYAVDCSEIDTADTTGLLEKKLNEYESELLDCIDSFRIKYGLGSLAIIKTGLLTSRKSNSDSAGYFILKLNARDSLLINRIQK